MGILLVLLLLILGFFGWFAAAEFDEGEFAEAPQAQGCVVSPDGGQQCSPLTVDGAYQLPEFGTVIQADVNNGPVSPEFQTGYSITVDASGLTTIVVTPAGAETPVVFTVYLDQATLQGILAGLDSTGVFFLPTADDLATGDVPVGGDVNNLTITLADGQWSYLGAGLDEIDQMTLQAAQRLLAEAVGYAQTEPGVTVEAATPAAM